MPTHLSATRATLGAACAASLLLSGVAIATITGSASAADPAGYQSIRINEVTSNDADTVELFNAGSASVSISGWKMADNGFSPQSFSPSSTTIAAGGFVTFASPKGLGDADTVVIYTADGTVVDRVDWATDKAKPAMARCGGDGTGTWVTAVASTTFGGTNAVACPSSLPPTSKVRINEVTSTDSDTVELVNTGTSSVGVSSWKFVDGDTTFSSSIGLGDNDSLFLLDNNGNTVDSVTWATNAATPSIQRCTNGTGAFATALTATLGGANSCTATTTTPTPTPTTTATPTGTATPTATPTTGVLTGGGGSLTSNCAPEAPSGSGSAPSGALTWPGGLDVTIADKVCAFTTSTGPEGRDVSGLAFDPAHPSVLWAVKNKNWLFKLTKSGSTWIPDSTWSSSGKQLRFAGGSGEPDTEGLTVGGDGLLYVTSERDNANNTVAKDTVMQFNPAGSGSTLTATKQWDMTSRFPQLQTGSKDDANLGFEGVAYVPDSWLVDNGWVDLRTKAAYNPANYPLHGSGLFFAGLEDDGKLYVYALNSDGSLTTFGSVSTGASAVMDVTFDAGTQRIIATCDNTCGVAHTVMKISAGAIVKEVSYKHPAVMPNDNLEGFALAPISTCVSGRREAVWSDDGIDGSGSGSAGYGHALYSGTFPC